MKLSIIAAIGKNGELGKDNKMIWHLPNDLKFFKDMTMGKYIIMGYNTYISLPRKLVNRKYIVLSLNHHILDSNIKVFSNIESLLTSIKDYDAEIFVIGGGKVYSEFIDLCQDIYLTEIDASDRSADVYFPPFDKEKYKREVLDECEENKIKYKHVVYRRK